MNSIDFKKRTAVITGGAAGIGLAVAQRLAASGATVALWDRDATALKAAKAAIAGVEVTHALDVADAGARRGRRPDGARAHRLHAVEKLDGTLRRRRGDRGAGRVARERGLLVLDRRGVRRVGRARNVLATSQRTASMILPTCCEDSINAWAAAASA